MKVFQLSEKEQTSRFEFEIVRMQFENDSSWGKNEKKRKHSKVNEKKILIQY